MESEHCPRIAGPVSEGETGPDPFIDVHTRVLVAGFMKNVYTLRKIFIEVFGRADQTDLYVDVGHSRNLANPRPAGEKESVPATRRERGVVPRRGPFGTDPPRKS
jgi:hypothetical protein